MTKRESKYHSYKHWREIFVPNLHKIKSFDGVPYDKKYFDSLFDEHPQMELGNIVSAAAGESVTVVITKSNHYLSS